MNRPEAASTQAFTFQRPAILGATPMGALIAARFADAGVRVRLYDRAGADAPNARAQAAITALLQMRPLPFAGQEAASLMDARNYRDHWSMLAEHDLVIECAGDDLAVKQGILSRIAPGLQRDAVILSISGGLSVEAIAQCLPAGCRPRFLGAHFFRPPRFQRAIELIPASRTEPRTQERVQGFFRDLLGAEIVVVPDSDNFAANRFQVLAVTSAFHHAAHLALPLEDVASLTALVCGRYDGGLIGLLDRIGWQRFCDIHARTPASDYALWGDKITLPPWIASMAERHGNARAFAGGLFAGDNATAPAYHAAAPDDMTLSAFRAYDWAALASLDHAHARFVCAWLGDIWTALAHVSRELALPPEALDILVRHGLAWQVQPHQLLLAFNPKKVLKTLGNPPSVLKSLKGRRNSEDSDARQLPNPFADKSRQWRDLRNSSSWRYQEGLLIWQPRHTRLALDRQTLDELATICTDAKQEHRMLLLYHRGETFGHAHDWRQLHHSAPQEVAEESAALSRLLMELRMLPRPVLASITGDVHDSGCAILMQADRIISDMDLRCHLAAPAQGLLPFGAIAFEWLRRLPSLTLTVHLEQIHAVLAHLINKQGGIGVHRMRELGLARAQDMFVMNRAVLPQMTSDLAHSWLNARLPRSYRVPQPALSAEALSLLAARADTLRDPELYRRMLTLFAADSATPMLSLSMTLARERELFLNQLAGNAP
ncbi:MAG: 3-hydroxyacyl-CoA dehydrogenase NAD-binding domain-containing protein [Cardiobacteriaceae bacterium]|nr:3-hydroxyacyl-CoA dehydrogenase NAD-binding domain-containing protein [Cardiobacteriaceae bacterium]